MAAPVSVMAVPSKTDTFSVSGAQRLRRLRLGRTFAWPSSLSSPDRLPETKQEDIIILLVIQKVKNLITHKYSRQML
jgi:hypothetical protein